MHLNVFFDMDGVLAVFADAAWKIFGYSLDEATKEFEGSIGDDFFDIPKLIGVSEKKFWSEMDSHEFWAGLGLYKDGFSMLHHVSMNYDATLWCITSSARQAASYSGKYEWFMKHVSPTISINKLIMTSSKYICAARNCVLVDDKTSNANTWMEYGGKAFLVGRPWNIHHFLEDHNYEMFKEFIERVYNELQTQ